MNPTQLLTTVLALSILATAWPWPPSLDNIKALNPLPRSIQRRQDDSTSSATASTAPKSTSQPSKTSSPSDSKSTTSSEDPNSTSDSKSSTDKSDSSKTRATKTSKVSINPAAGAGGIALITPASTLAESPLYKIDSTITWVWNYTSLTSPPAAIDILMTQAADASSAVPSAYTLATNVSYEATQTFKWDSGKYYSDTSMLQVTTYTLLVYDAALPTYSATASPGFLGLYNQFSFGLYTGQPRVDLTDPYVCATCNGAGSLERLTLGALMGIVGLTVGTTMWFAGVWGAF